MLSFWSKPLITLCLLALGSAVLWPLVGPRYTFVALCSGLLIWLGRHLLNLYRFRRWLKNPTAETVPQGSGLWESVYAALYRLVRRQRQSESNLSTALERFRQAGAAMPDGMVILDETFRIEWCNPKASQHFGIDLARDQGQQITYLVRQPQFLEYLNAKNSHEPLVIKLPRDMEVTLTVQLVPYGEKQKLLLSRDITYFERLETMRRDFVANVSHELRSPLTVLCGFLETITETPAMSAETNARVLRLMQEQAQRMQRLVEDLLTLSRLESAQIVISEDAIDMPQFLRALHHDALQLSEGRHNLKLSIESEWGMRGSEDELRSAFSNLISNAIRYTADGGEIRLRWRMEDGEPQFVVEDSGIGIASEHIPRLTERFYRVDRGRSRETGGTGLGLAIVKHVLSRHQGRLEIESELGRGSRFSAVFPAHRALAPGRSQPSTELERAVSVG